MQHTAELTREGRLQAAKDIQQDVIRMAKLARSDMAKMSPGDRADLENILKSIEQNDVVEATNDVNNHPGDEDALQRLRQTIAAAKLALTMIENGPSKKLAKPSKELKSQFTNLSANVCIHVYI